MLSVAPYGEWVSPVTSALIASESIRLGAPLLDTSNADVYWVEGRPSEGGRCVLCRSVDGKAVDVSPPSLNVRTRVHEYGGGEAFVHSSAALVSNFADQRLYWIDAGAASPATPDSNGEWRFADCVNDFGQRRVIAVAERHAPGAQQPENCLVALAGGGAPTVLASGADFYASPRCSEDGHWLAWVEWRHPNMPWDATTLRVAQLLPDGTLGASRCVAGGDAEAAVMQPRWSRDGSLHFLSDVSGFWNLYRIDADALRAQGGAAGDAPATALCPRQAEFGSPAWTLGASSYALLSDGRALVTYRDAGAAAATLAVLPLGGGEPIIIPTPFSEFSGLTAHGLWGVGCFRIALLGARPDAPTVVASLDVLTGEALEAKSAQPCAWVTHRAASSARIDIGYLSVPRTVAFPAALLKRTDGGEDADADAGVAVTSDTELSYCNYYAPRNADFAAPAGTLPPLLVKCHGGPTSSASTAFNLVIQYWTSRGWAVADVDYGGSSSHGRDYRRRLRLAWGIVDVADACCAATTLAARGLVDPARCAIDGGSAGGFTTLAALAFRPGVFAAGASHYGIGDLEALAADTHKFEARYLDGLVGPYPQAQARYKRRSPLHSAAHIAAPLALFQGSDDKVVPPEQAHAVFDAVRARGLPAALCVLQGEGHGFRAAASIRASLDGERCFFGRVFGFGHGAADTPPDVPPLEVVNMA